MNEKEITKITINDLPEEIIILIFNFLSSKELCNIRLAQKFFEILSNDRSIWRHFYQRDHSYHFAALELIDKYQSVDWGKEYKKAVTSPWNFLQSNNLNSGVHQKNSNEEVVKAITLGNYETVFAYLSEYLKEPAKLREPVDYEIMANACLETDNPLLFQLFISFVPITKEKLHKFMLSACTKDNLRFVAILVTAGAEVHLELLQKAFERNNPTIIAILKNALSGYLKCFKLYANALISNRKYRDILIKLPEFNQLDLNNIFPVYGDEPPFYPLQKAIVTAINSGNVEDIEWLISNGAKLETLYFSTITPKCTRPIFFYLVDYLSLKIKNDIENVHLTLKTLLKFIPDINLQDINGHTFIHYAVKTLTCSMLAEIFPILIDHSANLKITNHANQTLLHSFLIRPYRQTESYTDSKNYRKILVYLLDEIDIDIPDISGITPLFLASSINVSALIPITQRQLRMGFKKLFNNAKGFVSVAQDGGFFNFKNNQEQDSPLHLFVSNWQPIQTLFEMTDSIYSQSIRDDEWKLILELQIQEFRQMNFSPNSKNSEGKTPLQIAIDRNQPPLVEAILANGAHPENQGVINNPEIIDQLKSAKAFNKCLDIIIGKVTVRNEQVYFDIIKSKGLGRRLVMKYISDFNIDLNRKSIFISRVLKSNLKGELTSFYHELAMRACTCGTKLIKYQDILLILQTNIEKQKERGTLDFDYLRRVSRASMLQKKFLADNDIKEHLLSFLDLKK